MDVVALVVRSRDGRGTTIKRTPSVRGTELKVTLVKQEKKPLGLQLAEMKRDSYHHAVFIRNIAPGSPADLCQGLM